jgi:serine/threonine protein kinase
MTAGERLGEYELIAPIGAGGMGEVYLAEGTRPDRKVAIKLLPADFAADEDRVRRSEQGARATSALNHPKILI